ncbi:MAG TPA: hypothetical protein VKB76_20520 [Ktedonobacterales bacterium]|nr:hypothetical protein [Ktedonobacterales bacterium]
MAEDNRFGFHGRHRVGHDHNTGMQGRMEPDTKGRAGMKEPTNHGGHTYGGKHQAAHQSNVEHMRAMHAGRGQADHERILHETHKLHQTGNYNEHGNSKHGESHHIRNDKGE